MRPPIASTVTDSQSRIWRGPNRLEKCTRCAWSLENKAKMSTIGHKNNQLVPRTGAPLANLNAAKHGAFARSKKATVLARVKAGNIVNMRRMRVKTT